MTYHTTFTSPHARWITPVFLFLAAYTFGAGMLDSFAMYHSWRFVGPADFPKMHLETGKRIIAVLVLPAMVMTVFQVLLFWHRPRAVSRKLVWLAMACNIITWVSSFLIQIPIQAALDKDAGRLGELLATDWIRIISNIVFAVAVFGMMVKSVGGEK